MLGTDGEILDQGRAHRFFTPAQMRRLWLRDAGCTYPGCSMPPHWADGHHLVHWADFGPTDLGNATSCKYDLCDIPRQPSPLEKLEQLIETDEEAAAALIKQLMRT